MLDERRKYMKNAKKTYTKPSIRKIKITAKAALKQ